MARRRQLLIGLLGVSMAAWLALPVLQAGEDEYEYEGNKSCKKCHSSTFKSWEKTAHGQAFETLKPGQASEAKQKYNLDPAKDYTQDTKCLKCHTVGFGHASGYQIPDPEDKKAVRTAAKFEGVGCENCHGAGEKYAEVFKEIQKEQRKYKLDELYAVGLKPVDEKTCLQCHDNKESPTFDPNTKFDFEKKKEEGVHDHEELKLREG